MSPQRYARVLSISVFILLLSLAFSHASGGRLLAAAPRALILEQTIPAPEGEIDSYFGQVMAVDGNTAVIAAPRKQNGDLDDAGAVYVYVRDADTWVFQQKLTPSNPAADDNFGASIALSGDTVFVGAVDSMVYVGKAYVFTRTGTTWTQQTQINSPDASIGDVFGAAVKLVDGVAYIGALNEAGEGAVYRYTGSGATWTMVQKLTASDGASTDLFGASLAVQGDQMLIGAPGKNNGNVGFAGAVYVFERDGGGNWSELQKLTHADPVEDDLFGWSVALDGTSAIIGAPQSNSESVFTDGSGKAYYFSTNGTTWTQTQKLTQSDATPEERFGWQVILVGDTAYISDDGADEPGIGVGRQSPILDVGAVYTFTRTSNTWTQQSKLSPEEIVTDKEFGGSFALIGDTLLVGSPGTNDELGEDFGEVYVYREDPSVTATPSLTLVPSSTPTGTLTATPTATLTSTPDTPTPNLLVNGGFEDDINLDGTADGWTLKNPTNDKRVCNKVNRPGKPDKIVAFEGSCAFQFKSAPGENSAVQQVLDLTSTPLIADDVLTLGGVMDAKGEAVNTAIKVRVTYVDTTLAKGKINFKLAVAGTGYTPLTGTLSLTLAGDAAGVKVTVQNKGTSGKVRYDALSLTKGAGGAANGGALLPLP
jgi:hypothetical protein